MKTVRETESGHHSLQTFPPNVRSKQKWDCAAHPTASLQSYRILHTFRATYLILYHSSPSVLNIQFSL